MVVVAIWMGLLGLSGCTEAAPVYDPNAPCVDDPCRGQRAPVLIQADYHEGMEMLTTIEDPVYLSMAINSIINTTGSVLSREEGVAICELGAHVMKEHHCRRRFETVHLQQHRDQTKPLPPREYQPSQ